MQCPSCSQHNRAGAKFCSECGTKLERVCPGCDAKVALEAKYCDSCGACLAPQTSTAPAHPGAAAAEARARSPGDAERRHLTVMFCDLVGSSALAERLDPEDLRDLLAAYQDTCAGEIGRYEGFIARYVGDGLLVYFGYPSAHEDDATRAVRAGLGIAKAMDVLNASMKWPDVKLAVRIGITTGLVVVGDIGTGGRVEHKAVVGETPNIAARLQTVANPGTVVIGAPTMQLIDGLFDCEELGPKRLKGVQSFQKSVIESEAPSR